MEDRVARLENDLHSQKKELQSSFDGLTMAFNSAWGDREKVLNVWPLKMQSLYEADFGEHKSFLNGRWECMSKSIAEVQENQIASHRILDAHVRSAQDANQKLVAQVQDLSRRIVGVMGEVESLRNNGTPPPSMPSTRGVVVSRAK